MTFMVLEFILSEIRNRNIIKRANHSNRYMDMPYDTHPMMPIERMLIGKESGMECEIVLSSIFFDILILEFKNHYSEKLIRTRRVEVEQRAHVTVLCASFIFENPMAYNHDEVDLRVINADKSKGYKPRPEYESYLTSLLMDNKRHMMLHMGMDMAMPSKPIMPNTKEVLFTACKLNPKRKPTVAIKTIKPKAIKTKKIAKV